MSDVPNVLIVDLETGEVENRPMNDEELAQYELDQQAAAAAVKAAAAHAWGAVRAQRDRWLAQTDYIGVFLDTGTPTDLPDAIKKAIAANGDAWKVFRQQLRDLPASASDPAEVKWPKPPAAPAVLLT